MIKKFKKNSLEVEHRPVSALTISGSTYPDYEGWVLKLTSNGIAVYDNEGTLQSFFENVPCREALHLADSYLYILCEESLSKVISYVISDEGENKIKNEFGSRSMSEDTGKLRRKET